jgi:hypothetical protein
VPGALYDLSFALSRNPWGTAPTTTLVVSVGNLTGDSAPSYSLDAYAERTSRSMLYTVETLTFEAVDNETTLTFAENDSEASAEGMVIDYVAVVYSDLSEWARAGLVLRVCFNP